ncbi:MAG: hypothetical protein WC475_03140, partial [Candidatus Paceibacterota bacterium]
TKKYKSANENYLSKLDELKLVKKYSESKKAKTKKEKPQEEKIRAEAAARIGPLEKEIASLENERSRYDSEISGMRGRVKELDREFTKCRTEELKLNGYISELKQEAIKERTRKKQKLDEDAHAYSRSTIKIEKRMIYEERNGEYQATGEIAIGTVSQTIEGEIRKSFYLNGIPALSGKENSGNSGHVYSIPKNIFRDFIRYLSPYLKINDCLLVSKTVDGKKKELYLKGIIAGVKS